MHNAIPASRTTLMGGYKFQDRDTAVDSQIEGIELINRLRSGTLTAQPLESRKVNKPRRFQVDRVCSVPECNSVLSTYNKGPKCYAHADFKPGRIRGKVM